MKRRVLFLCTGNSARSQMAEGLLRHLAPDQYAVFSAGTSPASAVNPMAVRVMQEIEIDLTGHRPKHLRNFLDQPFHRVVTVCDHAAESCPTFPGDPERIHWGFDDPAAVVGTEEEQLAAFRRTRRELQQRLRLWLNIDARRPEMRVCEPAARDPDC
jgi:arsenate reductase (thioredoxin)